MLISCTLYFKPVQNFVLRQTQNWLANKLKTEVLLGDIYINYSKGIELKRSYIKDLKGDTLLSIGNIKIASNLWSLFSSEIDVKDALIEDVVFNIVQQDSTYNFDFILDAFSSADTSTTPTQWRIKAANTWLNLNNFRFSYKNNNQKTLLTTHIAHLQTQVDSIDLAQEIYSLKSLSLENGTYKYKSANESKGKKSNQFDSENYAFQSIKGKISDLKIQTNRIEGNLEELSGSEKSGLRLNHLASKISYLNNQRIIANETHCRLNESILKGDIDIVLPDDNQDVDALSLNTNIQTTIQCRDILYFWESPELKKKENSKIGITGHVKGILADLDFNRLSVDYDSKNVLVGKGRLKNVLSPNQLLADWDIQKLNLQYSDIADWLPQPMPIQLLNEDKLQASGKLFVTPSQNKFNFNTIFNRQGENLVAEFSGQTTGKAFTPQYIDVSIQKIQSSKTLLEQFIPKEAMPQGTSLPTLMTLNGTAKGAIDSIQLALNLDASRNIGDSSRIQINAFVISKPNQAVSFKVDDLSAQLSANEIWAWLPQDKLKGILVLNNNIPIKGKFKGNAESFESDILLDLNDKGQIQTLVKKQGDVTHITLKTDKYQPQTFLTDSIKQAWNISEMLPLSMDSDIELDTFGNFSASLNASYLTFGKPDKVAQSIQHISEDDNIPQEESPSENKVLDIRDYPFYLKNIEGKVNGNFNKQEYSHTELSFFLRDKRTINTIPTHSEVQTTVVLDSLSLKDNQEPFAKGIARLSDIYVEAIEDRQKEEQPEGTESFSDNIKRPSDLYLALNIAPLGDTVKIYSDWVSLETQGRFDVLKISEQFQAFINDYFQLNGYKKGFEMEEKMSLKGFLKPYELVPPALLKQIKIPNKIDFDGQLQGVAHSLSLNITADTLNVNKIPQNNISMRINADKEALYYELDGYTPPQYSVSFNNLEETEIRSDSIWENSIAGKLSNNKARMHIAQRSETTQVRYQLGLDLSLKNNETEIRLLSKPIFNFKRWRIKPANEIHFNSATKYFDLKDLVIAPQDFTDNYLSIAGNSDSGFVINAENFRINAISAAMFSDSNLVQGILKGQMSLKNIYQAPSITAALNLNEMILQGINLGDGKGRLEVALDNEYSLNNSSFDVELAKNKGEIKLMGSVFSKDSLDIRTTLNEFDCSSLLPFMKPNIMSMTGRASGNWDLKGTLKEPDWQGLLKVKDLCFKPSANLATYCIKEQNIPIDKYSIALSDTKIEDEQGNIAILDGKLYPLELPKFKLDFTVSASDFILLNNVRDKINNYQGLLKADVKGLIKGTSVFPDIQLALQIRDGAKLTYIYDKSVSSKELGDGLVIFNPPPQYKRVVKVVKPTSSSDFKYNLSIDISDNDNLLLTTIVDPLKGDFFEGKGSGALHLNMKSDGTMKLIGKYAITSGKYLYIINGLSFIKKQFTIGANSSLSWTGNPFNPELDLSANYLVRTIPPQPPQTTTPSSSNKETFITSIEVTGTLEKPDINFRIKYPTGAEGQKYGNSGDAFVIAEIDNINSSASSLPGTFMSLLTLNSFPDTKAYDLGLERGVSFFITQQLNQLTKEIKFADISFNSADGNNRDANNNMIGLNVSKDFFNKRLNIQLSSAFSTQSTPLLQKVVTTYSLKKSSNTWKLRGIYEGEDNRLFQDNPSSKIGVGLIYLKSFK